MSTVITHIYNEQALLPLWLKHHAKTFKRGIVIDFASTDASREIVKAWPTFELIDSPLTDFDAPEVDRMVENVERDIKGIRMVLNVTEFLLGDPNQATRDHFIPSVSPINMTDDPPFDWSYQFWEQRTRGISFERDFNWRRSRRLGLTSTSYPLGRHFGEIDRGDYLLVHVASCLVDERMIERRLQIQHKIPAHNKAVGMGIQHHFQTGLTREMLIEQQDKDRANSIDLMPWLRPYL